MRFSAAPTPGNRAPKQRETKQDHALARVTTSLGICLQLAGMIGLWISAANATESTSDSDPTTLRQDQATTTLYENNVKPILKERCFACHGALKQEAGLRIDTVRAIKGHGIIDGETVENSELMRRLTTDDENVRMPPEGKPLSSHQIHFVRRWLAEGAPGPENEQAETATIDHWAFQAINRPRLPSNGESNPIDAFLEQRFQKQGLKPQASATSTLLIRRLYLDVIGLPPSDEQLHCETPMPELVDSLLDSSHYGERWGRHWMDVWRYSDWYGLGSELRNSQRHIWHWRDWIVNSLNADKGYDRMIKEMLAGDEIAPTNTQTLAATGFLARNYYLFNRTTWLDDTIEHTGKAFLGLTMNCAKCHDHKYDPISHEDYYCFRAIFEPHHVRLDALPGETEFSKNALPRVYDDKLDAPTYVHRRGDPSQPITDRVIQPGVPRFLQTQPPVPSPIELPAEAWAPGIRPHVQSDQIARAKSQLAIARANLESVKSDIASQDNSTSTALTTSSNATSIKDDFHHRRPDVWKTIGDGWHYHDGVLSQTQPTTKRSCLRSIADHPPDFHLSVRFRTTGGQKWKSTGIRFDANPSGQFAHTVYASAYSGGPKVQLAHLADGSSVYPAAARSDKAIQENHDYTLMVRVRDSLINVFLNNEFLFASKLPQRANGSIELFAFDSTADFYSIDLRSLPPDVAMVDANQDRNPIKQHNGLAIAAAELALAEAELKAIHARIKADNAVLRSLDTKGKSAETLVNQAGRLTLQANLAKAEVEVLKADTAYRSKAMERRDAIIAEISAGKLPNHMPLRGSQRALDQKTHQPNQYPPIYPKFSSGRRTALANWITDRKNPLTARVAINHIWQRHFGTPLVKTVFDFGRRSPPPVHQNILDYLAMELIDSDWSMKHIHRIILNSKAWQRSSSNLNADPQTVHVDPQNRYYWRMNNRRMESQVIRDSLLSLSGKLDLTVGGPPQKSASSVRRSLYLVHSREQRDKFVSTFDDADVLSCYQRTESVVPQQALAMMNSRVAFEAAEHISQGFDDQLSNEQFVVIAFERILARLPSESERQACLELIESPVDRADFVHVLLNHNDFQVIR